MADQQLLFRILGDTTDAQKDTLAFRKATLQLEEATKKADVALEKYGAESMQYRKALLKAEEAQHKLTRAQKQTTQQGKTLGQTLSSLKMGFLAAAAGAVAVGRAMWEGIKASSDLNEAVNKSAVVFGKSSAEVAAWAKTMAHAFGQSERQATESAATFGNLWVTMGIGSDKAAEMSMQFVELASDLASFNNSSPEEALIALRAGLAGEVEPLRRFGVLLNDAQLRQTALSMGLVKTTKEVLPPAVRAQAAYKMILEQTKTAQGDFTRTSDGAANSLRIFTAEVENFKASWGDFLTGPFTRGLVRVNNIIELMTSGGEGLFEVYEENGRAVLRWNDAIEAGVPATNRFAEAGRDAAAAGRATKVAFGGAIPNVEGLGDAEDGLADSTRDATKAWQAQQLALSPSENNLRAVTDNVVAYHDAEKALGDYLKGGGKKHTAEYNDLLQEKRDKYQLIKKQAAEMSDEEITAAEKAGILSKKIADYARKVNDLPKKKTTKVEAKVEIHSKGAKFRIVGSGKGAMAFTGGGRIPAFAEGGISQGPTSGYAAMLHGREAIIPINDKLRSRMLLAQTAKAMGYSISNANNVGPVTVNIAGSTNMGAAQVQAAVETALARVVRRSGQLSV